MEVVMERFLEYFVPKKYVLDINIDKNKKTIGGMVTVTGEALAELVKFHAVNLKIKKVLVDGKKVEFINDGEVLSFNIKLGKHNIEIFYNGKLNENMQGAYLSTYEHKGKTEVVVATQFESHYAREAFPCIDEPAAKAVFELTITTPDKDDIVLSNMPEVPEKHHLGHAQGRSPELMVLDGVFSRTFEPTPRMSTYLLAWVIGRFHGKTIKNAHGTKITTYVALNQDINSVDFANEIAAKSLEFYDNNFGVPYPLEKLDQVALPDFEAGAMENWGLVTYRESLLVVGEKATLGAKKGVALTVAHELSHQWFGDLVTMEWWDDLWLNESFASIMEYYAVDYIHPEYKIFEGFFTGDCLAALKRDCLSGVQSVHQDVKNPEEIATLFDPAIVYAKGARLMLMIIRAMGFDKFTDGLKNYFTKFKYKNTVGDDLWAELNTHADFDVKKLMHMFIDQPGYPVITNKKGDFDEYTQKRFLLDGPLENSSFALPKISEDMSGHYIINLSEEEFNKRLEKFESLSLEEKLRLLIDRDLVAKTELASSGSLVPLIMKFGNENSAAIWNIIVMISGNLKIFFEDNSPEEAEFKKMLLKLARPKLDEIGIVTKPGDDENVIRLRSNLFALLFYAEDMEVLKKLAKLYNENYEKMDSEVRDDILNAKIYLEPEIVDKYIKDYQKIADPDVKFDLLFATTVSKNEMVIDKMISLLSQPEIVKPQDQFHLFIYLYRNPAARKKAFDYMVENWDYIKKMAGDKSIEDYPRYVAMLIKNEEDFKRYDEFFGPMKNEPALARAIEVGENEIRAKLDLIKADREEVYRTLKGLVD